jgi:hypothetical protein
MRVAIVACIAITLFAVASAYDVDVPLHREGDKPLPTPVDFHKDFTYDGCGAAFKDIIGQVTLLYGDMYGSVGLNTAFYRLYQFVMIRIPTWWTTCF